MFKYSIMLQWSDEDNGYVALIPEIPGVSAVADTPEDAVREVQVATECIIETLIDDNEIIPTPDLLTEFSGQLRIRMPKTLHERLAIRAKFEGVSLNSCINYLLASALDAKRIDRPADDEDAPSNFRYARTGSLLEKNAKVEEHKNAPGYAGRSESSKKKNAGTAKKRNRPTK